MSKRYVHCCVCIPLFHMRMATLIFVTNNRIIFAYSVVCPQMKMSEQSVSANMQEFAYKPKERLPTVSW